MKFTINKKTNVRKAFDDNGTPLAVFGFAQDLLKANILLELAKGCERNVISIHYPDFQIIEHETIEDAKIFIMFFSDGLEKKSWANGLTAREKGKMKYLVRMKTGMSDGLNEEFTFENCLFDIYCESKKVALELRKKYGCRRILPPLYYVMKFK